MFKRQVFSSKLYDQNSFYPCFTKDIQNTKERIIIESPYVTLHRVELLIPFIRNAKKRGVKDIVNTKPINEHNPALLEQVKESIAKLQAISVVVFITVRHHRKLAIIDSDVLWEGSLNILSQHDSCEIMRRIESSKQAGEMLNHIDIIRWI